MFNYILDEMEDFYIEQAGSGISSYTGNVRFQKGHGFFGRILSGGIIPLLKQVLPFLGKQALAAGTDIVGGLNSGSSFKEATKTAMKRRVGSLADDALVKIKSKLYDQDGNGIDRKRRKLKRRSTKTDRKVKRNPVSSPKYSSLF